MATTFRLEISLDEWKYLEKCWKTIEKNVISSVDIKNDNKNELNQCINALNNKLFDNNRNNNTTTKDTTTTSKDISIETMNNLLLEIDYDMKNNENENENENNKNNNNHNNNNQESKLDQLYHSKIVHFIESPVKIIYTHITHMFIFFLCIYLSLISCCK